MRILLIALIIMLVPVTAIAHHSRAAYDSSVTTVVEGELINVRWRNPHIVFTLRVDGAHGETVDWRMEAGSIYKLARGGLTKEMFTSGNRVKVAGYLSKTEQRDFLATNMLFGGGKEILTMPNVDPYWTDDRLGAQDAWQSDDERLAQTEPSQGGIFQVWSIPRSGGRTSTLPFRQSAIAARANWDMVDNPMTRCEQPGMPRIMANPHPFEFIEKGDHIVFLGEEFDMVRTLYLDTETSAGAAIPSNMGYSVARWEDGTLIIHTSKINWPFFDGIGTPQSDAVEVVERYTLSEDQRRLDYVITTTDPSILTGPAIYEGYWLALGENVEPFDCEQF